MSVHPCATNYQITKIFMHVCLSFTLIFWDSLQQEKFCSSRSQNSFMLLQKKLTSCMELRSLTPANRLGSSDFSVLLLGGSGILGLLK